MKFGLIYNTGYYGTDPDQAPPLGPSTVARAS